MSTNTDTTRRIRGLNEERQDVMNRLTRTYYLVIVTLSERWQQLRREPERGDITDNVALMATLAALALTIVGLLTAKLTGAINSISF